MYEPQAGQHFATPIGIFRCVEHAPRARTYKFVGEGAELQNRG